MRQAYPSGIRITAVPRRVGLTIVGAALCLLAVGAGSALPQVPAGDFFEAIDHPAIGYHSVAPSDRVAQLARRIAAGEQTLTRDDQTGYLPALLRALDIPVASQLAVFSPTSLQKEIISPQNPRVIYFNESTVVAWPRGGFIEIAAQDPRQGVIFYAMPQQLLPRPSLIRRDDCLRCHYSHATGGVPGLLARSVVTGPRGESMPFLGNYLTDDRSPLEERWAGWFVTGLGVFAVFAALDRDDDQDTGAVALYVWTWVGEAIANAFIWRRPRVALAGGLGMGAFALPALRR